MSLHVREAVPSDESAWDAFVMSCNVATFCHRFGWAGVIERSFGHRTHYLLAERKGAIEGVLPLTHVKSRLFGNSLSSQPFCVYGGIAATSHEAEQALRLAARELSEALQVDALEFRSLKASASGWPEKDLYVTFRREILPEVDANMLAIPKKQRAMVRKGIKSGLSSEETTDTSRLYRVYAESVRNLGTPVFTRQYFEELAATFGTDCRILMIRDENQDVAGVMSFYFRDQVLPYYGGSVSAARTIRGCNDFMYWELMRRSCEEGYRLFDFGRSKKGTGPYSFKKNWGFEPEQLHYEYHLVKSDNVPEVNPLIPKYRLLVNTWQRLPLAIANTLGPLVAKDLG